MHPKLKEEQENRDGKTNHKSLRMGNYVKHRYTSAQPAEMKIKKTMNPQRPVKGQECQI
jgi:hypothetical protein